MEAPKSWVWGAGIWGGGYVAVSGEECEPGHVKQHLYAAFDGHHGRGDDEHDDDDDGDAADDDGVDNGDDLGDEVDHGGDDARLF